MVMQFSIFFDFLMVNFKSFSCFIAKMFFSDKESVFRIMLIIADIIEEYYICGI